MPQFDSFLCVTVEENTQVGYCRLDYKNNKDFHNKPAASGVLGEERGGGVASPKIPLEKNGNFMDTVLYFISLAIYLKSFWNHIIHY